MNRSGQIDRHVGGWLAPFLSMRLLPISRVRFVLSVFLVGAAVAVLQADTLEKVVILSRHGVRAAMSSPEKLGSFSARPWPRFAVPAGHLTPRGAELMRLLGGYYREHYRALGLLRDDDRGAVYYWASPTQRTIATAEALAETLSPGGPHVIHSLAEGAVDPLFEGAGKPDYALARAAVLGQIGGDLPAWSHAHRATLDTLDALLGQGDGEASSPAAGAGRKRLANEPLALTGDTMPTLTGPEGTASAITESLLMAWADGQDFAKLGWSGLNEETLLSVFAVHQTEMDLRLRAPYIAQFSTSHLATRLLATLETGTDVKFRYAPLGEAEPMVVVVGHDGTLVMLAGLLHLNWTSPGYQPGQVGPGGALIFERWRRAADGRRVIRLRYSVQTLPQLREARPLTVANPPASSPVFIPSGSESGPDFDCPLEQFDALVEKLIDPRFVDR